MGAQPIPSHLFGFEAPKRYLRNSPRRPKQIPKCLSCRSPRGTVDSQLADNPHELFHFSVHRGLAAFEMLLHADARKEGQDHLRERRRFHRGLLGFDISCDQIFEKCAALENHFLRRRWEYRELIHGIYRETAFLALQAARPEFQKAFDVWPPEWAAGQQFILLPFSHAVPQTFQIQISFVGELGIEAGLVYARSLFQFLKAGI